MTKRILCLILSLCTLFLFVGCNKKVEDVTDMRPIYKITDTEYDNVPYSKYKEGVMDWGYYTFEECLYKATDIVKATFLGTIKSEPDDYYFNFEITEELRGDFDDSVISIFVNGCDYGGLTANSPYSSPIREYDTYGIEYEVGKDYLLLLERRMSVHYDEDLLYPIHETLVLTLDDNGNPDIASSKMYGQEFEKHISWGEAFKAYILEGDFIEKILRITECNPKLKKDYWVIDDTDITKVLKGSDCIFIVTVEELLEDDYKGRIGNYKCKIIRTIKGEAQSPEIDGIYLTMHKVEVGGTYLLALVKYDSGRENFFLSSRNSIFPWEPEE